MVIRRMNDDDVSFAMDCVQAEGWVGETEQVFRGFLDADPAGCIVAEHEGDSVGLCIAVSYGVCGFIGELIVLQEFRRNGFGRMLMEHNMDYLQKAGCLSICLDGDKPATALYEKLGFHHVCESLRFVGTCSRGESSKVRPMTGADFTEIAAFDFAAFGADRSRYLTRRFKLFPELCKVLICKKRIAGYIMAQPGIGVTSVGPWVMEESVEAPLDLLASIAAEVADTPLRIGVLDTNAKAVTLLKSVGSLEETEPSFRMVSGETTNLGSSNRLFAIGSAAKG